METILVSMETRALVTNRVLEAHLGYWLRRVSNQVSGEFRRALQQRNVSVAEWVALCLIREDPGITPADLADALGVTRGAVSKVLEKLDAKQCIRRAEVPEDKRVQRLSLTASGVRLLPVLSAVADANDDRFFGCLAPDEQFELRRLLEKLATAHGVAGAPVD